MKSEFLLDPNIIFLNHGSFGATPLPVFESYQSWQRELERQPVEFLGRRATELLLQARDALASYVGTEARNIVYVTNATVGINIVAHSLHLGPGDEVLASDHEYGALDRTWRFLAQKNGFNYLNVPIRLPVNDPQEVVDAIWQAVTPATRVIFLSHITSPTALIFPVKSICQKARQHNILTVIDGAHAPGQIDLNLDDMDVDFYSGNLHKWLCAPKGAGFLYAHPRVQSMVEPLIVSWGWQSEYPGPSQFIDYLEWQGTRDLSAFLAVPDAIAFQKEHNWTEIQDHCHSLIRDLRRRIDDLTGLPPICPDSNIWFRQMAACRLPGGLDLNDLKTSLYNQFHIEVPIILWNRQPLIRFSIQAYNSEMDAHALETALRVLLRG